MLATSLIWGITNPILKRGATETQQETKGNLNFLQLLSKLFLNFKFVLAQLINWSGSVVFLVGLQYNALAIAVPVTNSFTFLFTEIADQMMEAKSLLEIKKWMFNTEMLLGVFFITVGIAVCLCA